MATATFEIKCCIDCPHHEVVNDPDPDDWFCDDDLAVVCSKALNPKQNLSSKYAADHSPHRTVVVGARPYKLRDEALVPAWCPLGSQGESA